ncbi:MAG TPA: DNA polymerase IV [Candidatus Acidoferrum sp.]|nr:DNA polymerase IV [Candidatus Acidoferrum sp.]
MARFRAKHGPLEERAADAIASILHVDMDAFFVSVELLERPELRGRPVVVGGKPDQRGVVTAASYEARKYGVHSAMPLRTAGRLCPHAVFLDGHHEKYGEWSDRVATILAKFSPIVEMVSIDEAYLDLAGTERLHGPPLAAADKLLRTITRITDLPCSAGLATTRLVAKVASDQAKPRGLVWVAPGQEARFLAQLPVRKIPGIGEVTERALRALGIETVDQLAAVAPEKLEKIFGQWGDALYRKARGGDSYEFVIDAEPKSISHNHTFGEDTNDTEALHALLSHLSQKACKRLREAGLATRTLTLTIRYVGFDTHTCAKTLSEPTQLDADIFRVFQKLFAEHRDMKRKIRLLGVGLGSLTHGGEQLDLLDAERRERLEKLTRATDKLRDRFGFGKVQFGGSLHADGSINERDDPRLSTFGRANLKKSSES